VEGKSGDLGGRRKIKKKKNKLTKEKKINLMYYLIKKPKKN